jgi:hypothetical protein
MGSGASFEQRKKGEVKSPRKYQQLRRRIKKLQGWP